MQMYNHSQYLVLDLWNVENIFCPSIRGRLSESQHYSIRLESSWLILNKMLHQNLSVREILSRNTFCLDLLTVFKIYRATMSTTYLFGWTFVCLVYRFKTNFRYFIGSLLKCHYCTTEWNIICWTLTFRYLIWVSNPFHQIEFDLNVAPQPAFVQWRHHMKIPPRKTWHC